MEIKIEIKEEPFQKNEKIDTLEKKINIRKHYIY